MFFAVLLSWIAVGLAVGFAGNRVVNIRGDDPLFGVAAATGGALLGGILYALLGGAGVSAWTWWGLASAALGAIAAAVAWHALRSRSISREAYKPRSSY